MLRATKSTLFRPVADLEGTMTPRLPQLAGFRHNPNKIIETFL